MKNSKKTKLVKNKSEKKPILPEKIDESQGTSPEKELKLGRPKVRQKFNRKSPPPLPIPKKTLKE